MVEGDTSSDSTSEETRNRKIPRVSPRVLTGLTQLEKACLEFSLSLLHQSSSKDEYELPLVGALAILGLTKDEFRGVDTYPSILSSILKISRFFVLRYSFESSSSIQDQGLPDFNADISPTSRLFYGLDLGVKPLSRLKTLVDSLLIRGSFTPINWLLDLRSYGLAIARKTTSVGAID